MPCRSSSFVASALTLALVVGACTSNGDDTASTTVTPNDTVMTPAAEPATSGPVTTEPAEPPTTTDAAPSTTMPRELVELARLDIDTGEVVIEEVDAGVPLTFEAVVDLGVQDGRWSEAEGLIRLLRAFVGEVPTDQVPGFDGVLSTSLSGLIAAIDDLEGATAEEITELTRLRRIVSPPIEAVEALTIDVTAGGPGDALQIPGAASPADCAAIQADAFSGSTTFSGGCYRMIEAGAAGATLRVFFPAWYGDTSLADFPQAALEALVTSVEVYAELATVGDMDLIFSLADDGGTLAIAVDAAAVDWGTATLAGTCPITMFPAAGSSFGAFQQTVAHEAWHCVQHYSGDMSRYGAKAWFMEGAAEYFSNVVYPAIDDEHQWLRSFDERSVRESLFDLDYATWIFWQYLANVSSPGTVADLHVAMSLSGDGGRSLMQGYAKELQEFTIAYVGGQIPDASGALLPRARNAVLMPPITENDEGKTIELGADPFVIRRFLMEYKQEYRFLQSDRTETDGREAMVELAKATQIPEWKGIFPEIRSECERSVYYVVAATTVDAPHEVKIQVDTVERAECDPCLLGTWEIRLDTFRDRLTSRFAAEGLPGGATFEFLGHYYVAMDDDGVVKEQRDGLTSRITAQGFAVDFVTDSFAEGTYTADGENLTVRDMVETYLEVTSTLGPLGINLGQEEGTVSIFGGPSVTVDGVGQPSDTGGTATYECDEEVLTVTVAGFDPITLDRVDKILEPPARD
jgi:hypothetical protein